MANIYYGWNVKNTNEFPRHKNSVCYSYVRVGEGIYIRLTNFLLNFKTLSLTSEIVDAVRVLKEMCKLKSPIWLIIELN